MAISKRFIGVTQQVAFGGAQLLQANIVEITMSLAADYVPGTGLVVNPSAQAFGPSAIPWTPPGGAGVGVPPVVGVQGAGTITTSGTTVTGSGTAFLTSLSVGSTITAAGQTQVVSAIASNTSLTTAVAFAPALSAATIYVIGGDVPMRAISYGIGYLKSSTGAAKGVLGWWDTAITVPAFRLFKTAATAVAFLEIATTDLAANDVFVGIVFGIS